MSAYQDLSKEELVVKVIELTHRLSQLERLVFGSRHERFIPSASQEQLALGLSIEKIETPAPVAVQTIEYARRQNSSQPKKYKPAG